MRTIWTISIVVALLLLGLFVAGTPGMARAASTQAQAVGIQLAPESAANQEVTQTIAEAGQAFLNDGSPEESQESRSQVLGADSAQAHPEDGHAQEGGHHVAGVTFAFLAILLLAAKVGGVVEKFGQPSVVGELAAGVVLSAFAYFGWEALNDIRTNTIMAFLAELGAVVLLFQVGLESNVQKLIQVGANSVFVALIGAGLPFALGTLVVGPLLFPDAGLVPHLFIGASLVATSVGIPASVFRALGKSQIRPARTFLGATLIDDVLGLITLAVVSAVAAGGEVTPVFVAILAGKAFGFLLAAVLFGNYMAPYISLAFSKISTGTGMKMGIAFVFALLYAHLATLVGLAPIVGAFAAGLILDAVHFKNYDLPQIAVDLKKIKGFDASERAQITRIINHNSHAHVEDLISSISLILVPLFFVFTGLQVDFSSTPATSALPLRRHYHDYRNFR